jgi:hypothetical protein
VYQTEQHQGHRPKGEGIGHFLGERPRDSLRNVSKKI